MPGLLTPKVATFTTILVVTDLTNAMEKFKISGTGWLCVMRAGKWIPITKLTDQQIQDFKDMNVEAGHDD